MKTNTNTMKTNQLFLLAALLLALVTTLPHAARAQVKIGANPTVIGSGSNLEVEATGGQKVIVNKADGTMIIQNAPTSTTNTFLLTTDANGLVSKQLPNSQTLPPVILGTLGSGINLAAGSAGYSGANITIPANSKYIVNLTIVLVGNVVISTASQAWVRNILVDTQTATVSTSDVQGTSVLFSGGLSFGETYGIVSGSVTVKNSTNSPKTYYLRASLASAGTAALPSGYTISNFASSGPGENQIYAIPAN